MTFDWIIPSQNYSDEGGAPHVIGIVWRIVIPPKEMPKKVSLCLSFRLIGQRNESSPVTIKLLNPLGTAIGNVSDVVTFRSGQDCAFGALKLPVAFDSFGRYTIIGLIDGKPDMAYATWFDIAEYTVH